MAMSSSPNKGRGLFPLCRESERKYMSTRPMM